jgi:hypothetical protein
MAVVTAERRVEQWVALSAGLTADYSADESDKRMVVAMVGQMVAEWDALSAGWWV